MSPEKKYYDIRSAFWRRCWKEAQSYDTYIEGSEPRLTANWKDFEKQVPPLNKDQRECLTGFERTLNVLVVSGLWCGDCVRQGPMIKHIGDSCDQNVAVKFIDRDQNSELRDEIRLLGAARVPMVLFLSEDFHEVGRFGDRMLTTYRQKSKTELGAACSVPAALLPLDELTAEYDEWVCIFERMLLMARLAPPLRDRYGD